MDQETIKAIIELVSNSNIGEVKIKQDKFKITIRHKDYITKKSKSASPVQISEAPIAAPIPVSKVEQNAPSQEVKQEISTSASEDLSKYKTIKSPMIGTFYRSPSPEQEPFVKVGDVVEKDSVIGIIEAMKLFNDIEAGISGKIVKVLVDNATAVEYDQDLFLIDPS